MPQKAWSISGGIRRACKCIEEDGRAVGIQRTADNRSDRDTDTDINE